MLIKMKDEYGIVLDFLPFGKGIERKKQPIAQIVGEKFFTLLEVGIRENVVVKPFDRVYIGDEKRDQVKFVKGRISYDDLTSIAKNNLETILDSLVTNEKIVEFFNKAPPISTRLHSIELLKGIGKKTLNIILEERRKTPFKDIEDLEKRSGIKNPKKIIKERILDELKNIDKYKFFVGVQL
ncbi:MAG: DUF655 domain-containing protein [Candidatus Aenigmarchaeota archaeon]|nr:DUF655 domain-containing protein [Candidatus Aenigmarchaeota archaeon]MDW8149525.1 DUF655 domain-containing protein [Candidatus Aenigmarchaeota archaeon]